MGLMMLFDVESVTPMWLLLGASLLLTAWEAREQGLALVEGLWWVLLVALIHVVGYLIMRGWFAWKQRQA